MKKKTKITTLLIFFLFLTFPPLPLAQTSSGEAELIESIRKKVEEKIEEKTEISQKQKRGFFGQVSDLFNQTIVLETDQGKKTAKIDQETILIGANRQKIKFEDLEIDNYLITMGYSQSADQLETNRVVVISQPKQDNRIAVMGRIKNLERTQFDLEPLRNSQSWQVILTPKTIINQNDAGEIQELEPESLAEDSLLIIIGLSEEKNQISAKTIRIVTLPSPIPESEEAGKETETEN
ncbi:MAG: hypothetical protein JW991_02645 [Candidatus Pacebacteria bacterium]|nr:hypothetical protein [Candidatus Paceibacterota bacterium]